MNMIQKRKEVNAQHTKKKKVYTSNRQNRDHRSLPKVPDFKWSLS